MTTKTRYFVISSLLVLTVGLGTGLVAYYVGLPTSAFSSRGGPDELQYVPRDAAVLAYANVQDIMTSDLRRQLNIGRDVQGVVITGIDGNSPPDIRGLSRGDVLVSINQEPVRSPEEAANKLRQAAKSQQKTALLLLNRRGVTQYVGVKLGKDEG